jgi:hypothetical protein
MLVDIGQNMDEKDYSERQEEKVMRIIISFMLGTSFTSST